MTEAEWLGCTDLEAMLESLGPAASQRRRRLFAVACCRRVWHLLIDPRCLSAAAVAERYADGQANLWELIDAQVEAHECKAGLPGGPYGDAAEAADWCAWRDVDDEVIDLVSQAAARAAGCEPAGANGEFIWREERSRAE